MAKLKIPSFAEISSLEYLLASWEEFRRRKKTKTDVAIFASRLFANLLKLEQELRAGVYRHRPYYYFKISDPKPRDIHKAMVRDRVIHHALYRALYPFFARSFIYDSFSCQKGKGTHRALRRFAVLANRCSLNNTKTAWLLKGDIKKCFASIDHQQLKKLLAQRLSDKQLLKLLDEIIDSFSSGSVGKGIPLGNLTSQLFVNIYLNEFDRFVKHRLKETYYLRYADDFVIMGRDRDHLLSLVPRLDVYLQSELKLQLHPAKISIRSFFSGQDFLGWVHFPKYRVLRAVSRRRMFAKLKKRADQPVRASYLGLLSHGNAHYLRQQVEEIMPKC